MRCAWWSITARRRVLQMRARGRPERPGVEVGSLSSGAVVRSRDNNRARGPNACRNGLSNPLLPNQLSQTRVQGNFTDAMKVSYRDWAITTPSNRPLFRSMPASVERPIQYIIDY